METKSIYDFSQWPLDLLLDYVLKIHHRGVREKGPGILSHLRQEIAKGNVPPETERLFTDSLDDLEDHLMKEEQVLFPYFRDLYDASLTGVSIPPIHCGTVRHPISVMMSDHDNETARHRQIASLLGQYAIREDKDGSYTTLMNEMSCFAEALGEHTAIENELIFPGFIALEDKYAYQ